MCSLKVPQPGDRIDRRIEFWYTEKERILWMEGSIVSNTRTNMKVKKKEFGQFFTEPTIAGFMVDLVLEKNSKTFLDPAVGPGVFPQIANERNPGLTITACEIDPEMIDRFKKENEYPHRLVEEDYLNCRFKEKYDAIICNPPYNKFQSIPGRENLIAEFQHRYHIALSGYSNICVYFLIKSINELKKNGKCCYIIPYEFMNTGYGVVIKQYLLDSGMLKTILKFDNSLNLFEEAITTSCIILLENKKHDRVELVNISDLEELRTGTFQNTKEYLYSELDPKEKWIQYFEAADARIAYRNTVKVSAFGKVSRGIATGANSYFTLNHSMIENRSLSPGVCLPCLTKAPDVKDVVFTEAAFRRLSAMDKKVYIFDGERAETEADFAYIKYGEETDVDKAYLTSHRNPWYAIEDKKPAPILICVFSRERIKVIRNEMGIKNLTAFHGFHLAEPDEELANILFCYLLTPIAQELLYRSRREYGDGLTKFEPNDLTKAEMLDLRLLRTIDRQRILTIYEEIKQQNAEVKIEELDAIFRSYLEA